MTDSVIIRNADHADLSQILNIYNDIILNTTAVYSEQPHSLEMRTDWFNERVNNSFPVFVAEQAGLISGFCSYGHFRIWPCYRFTVETSVYVAKDYRGLSISKLLVNKLIQHAASSGFHAMIAGISADNDVSIKLHSSFGFTEVAHFKEVGFKFGRWLDLKFFELIL